MARAKRHYIAGHIWHITHRCHKREFLLKFSKDRRRIDLKMMRAGVVAHPLEWIFSGYCEIQEPRRKCALIAYERLQELTGFGSYDEFTTAHRNWVEAFLEDGNCGREGKWTQSIAIGSEGFVEKTRQQLGIRARGRKVVEAGPAYQLPEPQVSYSSHFGLENDDIGTENTYFWDVY